MEWWGCDRDNFFKVNSRLLLFLCDTFFRQEHGKVLTARQTFDNTGFDPRDESDRTVCEKKREKLIETLRQCNSSCNFLRYNKRELPIKSEPQRTPSTSEIEQCALSQLKVMPPSLHDIEKACNSVREVFSVTEEQRHRLERLTIGQSDSEKWKNARKYRLTASNFHRIFKMKSTTNPKAALESLLYRSCRQTAAMAFGLKMEESAAKRYSSKTGARLVKRGLVVDKEFPFLGASVDRVTDNGEKIIEIKNPSSTWDLSLKEATKKLKCLKLDENNETVLNPSHEYYTQVQGQMGILGIIKCDFVLCTKNEIFIHEVSFDPNFWELCKKKIVHFYENVMLPEIVYPRVKFNLEPYVYSF